MRIHDGLKTANGRLARGAVAIGNFDGVHLGHRALLAHSRERAIAISSRGPVVALTFEPHPASVLAPALAPPRICTPARKLALLEAAGAEEVVVQPFDADQQEDLAASGRHLLKRALEVSHRARCISLHVGATFLQCAKALAAKGEEAGQIEDRPASVREVFVSRDGEEPCREVGVLAQCRRRPRELHPGVLQEILGDVVTAGETQQKTEDAGAVKLVGAVERGGLACPQALHQIVGRRHAEETSHASRCDRKNCGHKLARGPVVSLKRGAPSEADTDDESHS